MPALAPITISGLADKAGIDVETIRTYERMGLIEKPRRAPGGYLLYRGEDVDILIFIKRATSLGFDPESIRELLELSNPRSGTQCDVIYDVAVRQLAEIRRRLDELGRMEKTLQKLTDACPRDGGLTACPIIQSLVHQPA